MGSPANMGQFSAVKPPHMFITRANDLCDHTVNLLQKDMVLQSGNIVQQREDGAEENYESFKKWTREEREPGVVLRPDTGSLNMFQCRFFFCLVSNKQKLNITE